MNKEYIIKRFDYKIKEEIKHKKIKENCNSYWEKLLFIETLNFDLDDWEKVRTGDYFNIKDSLLGIDYQNTLLIKNKFTYKRVMEYVLSCELTIINKTDNS